MIELSSDSLEYIDIEVQCTLPSGTHLPLRSYAVDLAFITRGEPLEGDWHVAAWVADPDAGGRNVAQLLIGPGGPDGTLVLAQSRYTAFARVHATPELPVIRSGEQLVIT
jgi:hypothetical protein